MSSSTFFHRPELALRRALELQGIHQSEAALQLLHEVLSSRRHRTWSPAYEQIMIAYLDLCLKLHKAREAKDGLHQYRNLAQSQAPGSLEKVIRYLLDKAEEQCSKAKAAADAAATVSDSGTALSMVLDSDTTGDDDIEVISSLTEVDWMLTLSSSIALVRFVHLSSLYYSCCVQNLYRKRGVLYCWFMVVHSYPVFRC